MFNLKKLKRFSIAYVQTHNQKEPESWASFFPPDSVV